MLTLHIDTARTWRGGQNQALLTVLGLRSLGHRTVLVAHPRGELRRRASEGPDLIPLAPRGELDLAAAWRLARILRGLKPAIVHAHDPHGVAMGAAAIGYGTVGTPAPILVASRRVDFALRLNALSRWKYRQVRAFLCASECIRQMLLAQGMPADRVVTVHEGIDLQHVDAAPPVSVRETFWLPHNAPIVGCVGALVEHKGHRHLIRAAAQIVHELPDARVVILGEGELRPELTQLIRELGLERHVLLPGFRPDVLSLMKTFDVFVMPSITEGLGTSVLDALACRRPVVASRVGGIPEVVEDGVTGLLVPPRDPDLLAEAIVRLLQDRELADRLASTGRQRVEERFTAERMVEETVAVYRRLLASRQ
ncbi:MAG TPA: glycosyltransferase [Vicinamibacterales bacterium]